MWLLQFARARLPRDAFWLLSARSCLYVILNRYDVQEFTLAQCLRRLFRYADCDEYDLQAMLLSTAGRVGRQKWLDPRAPPHQRVRVAHHDLCASDVLQPWIRKCPYAWFVWMLLSPRAVQNWRDFQDVRLSVPQWDRLLLRLVRLVEWAASQRVKASVHRQYVEKLQAFSGAARLRRDWVCVVVCLGS